jgi:uncharacterized protein DUF4112
MKKKPDLSRTQTQLDHLAWLLDNLFRIPGTNWRFGLDALIGLVPGAGDVVAAILSLFLLVRAFQFRLPKIVILRMLINSLLDFSIGAIPLLGDAFDMFYKANTRNMKLFREYAEGPLASTTRHWIFIGCLIGGFLATISGAVILVFYVLWRLVIVR